jgi:hypothetical protein
VLDRQLPQVRVLVGEKLYQEQLGQLRRAFNGGERW